MSSLTSRLAALASPAIGLGCMNLSHGYGQPVPEAEALRALGEAFEMGYRHFDTATLYGATANERLVGKALASKRSEILLASKCGMAMDPEQGRKVIDGRPATLRRQCEESLARLQTDHIDLYYLHRWDRAVPIEESVGELGRLVEEGKIGAVGLSEVSARTLRRARAEHPIAAVQSEYSLWTRNPEIAVLEACREANTLFVAFSPLGRGFLAGAVCHYNYYCVLQNLPYFPQAGSFLLHVFPDLASSFSVASVNCIFINCQDFTVAHNHLTINHNVVCHASIHTEEEVSTPVIAIHRCMCFVIHGDDICISVRLQDTNVMSEVIL